VEGGAPGQEAERRRKMMIWKEGFFIESPDTSLRLAQAGFAWEKVSELCEQTVTSAKAWEL